MRIYNIKFFCDKCNSEITYHLSKKGNDKGELFFKGFDMKHYLEENIVCHTCGDNHIISNNDKLVSINLKLRK